MCSGYKYVKDPVRGKRARKKQLRGFECADCAAFYADASLSHKQMQDLMDRCSKHRALHPPPKSSPQDYWKCDMDGYATARMGA